MLRPFWSHGFWPTTGLSSNGDGRSVPDQIAGMGEVVEQGLVQERVPHPAVEAFDKAVLHRSTGRDVVSFHLVLHAPPQDHVLGHFFLTEVPSSPPCRTSARPAGPAVPDHLFPIDAWNCCTS